VLYRRLTARFGLLRNENWGEVNPQPDAAVRDAGKLPTLLRFADQQAYES